VNMVPLVVQEPFVSEIFQGFNPFERETRRNKWNKTGYSRRLLLMPVLFVYCYNFGV